MKAGNLKKRYPAFSDFFMSLMQGDESGERKSRIRSSRKLAESCKINLEVKWMLGGVELDFRTISDSRKVNIDSLKDIFYLTGKSQAL